MTLHFIVGFGNNCTATFAINFLIIDLYVVLFEFSWDRNGNLIYLSNRVKYNRILEISIERNVVIML